LGKWIHYYYCAWFQEDPIILLSELENYHVKKYPYTDAIAKQFKDNILEYWNYTQRYSKELYKIGQHIFSIVVLTAFLE